MARRKETEDVEAQVPEEAREEASPLPSFTVTFTSLGVEVTCTEMNAVPLATIERAQHVALRQIMTERQVAARKVSQSRESGWEAPKERT